MMSKYFIEQSGLVKFNINAMEDCENDNIAIQRKIIKIITKFDKLHACVG